MDNKPLGHDAFINVDRSGEKVWSSLGPTLLTGLVHHELVRKKKGVSPDPASSDQQRAVCKSQATQQS